MTEKTSLSAERLRSLLNYEPETGVFKWRERRPGVRADLMAGTRHGEGYLVIRVDGHLYLCHRLAWLYATGDWPALQIDHINGNRQDNRFVNLRECTNRLNSQNVRAHKDGSGLLGTSLEKRTGKWQSGIGINGKRIHLGHFDTQQEAHDAYLRAKRELHNFGEHNV